ncbi:hypothetical protein [Aquincola sp. J276]|uniref:hypothetical protein n=1 Tax=Aquincola sp. J276 TaxID=2898432 RepID=UPI002151A9F1|nr:hypothetical protein [Aquincola sp. J276]MCR5864679.1 hypothetical protein [Aquincola sp. J276]
MTKASNQIDNAGVAGGCNAEASLFSEPTQKRAVPFIQAPHPKLQDALFCYATGDDGASAELIRGWPALVARVVSDVAGDGWDEILADLDDWSTDGWGVPYRYSVNFEDGYMAIYRIVVRDAAPTAPQAPALVPLKPGYLAVHASKLLRWERDAGTPGGRGATPMLHCLACDAAGYGPQVMNHKADCPVLIAAHGITPAGTTPKEQQ